MKEKKLKGVNVKINKNLNYFLRHQKWSLICVIVLNKIYGYKYEELEGSLALKSIHYHAHVPSQTI